MLSFFIVQYLRLDRQALLCRLNVSGGGIKKLAERKFKPPFKFVNHDKLLLSANERPETPAETDSFFAHLIIINFPKQFIEGAKADPYFFEKISTVKELSGFCIFC
jgi:phage/plasmid-associated DNA primase